MIAQLPGTTTELPPDILSMLMLARLERPVIDVPWDEERFQERTRAFDEAIAGLENYDFDAWQRMREFERAQAAEEMRVRTEG